MEARRWPSRDGRHAQRKSAPYGEARHEINEQKPTATTTRSEIRSKSRNAGTTPSGSSLPDKNGCIRRPTKARNPNTGERNALNRTDPQWRSGERNPTPPTPRQRIRQLSDPAAAERSPGVNLARQVQLGNATYPTNATTHQRTRERSPPSTAGKPDLPTNATIHQWGSGGEAPPGTPGKRDLPRQRNHPPRGVRGAKPRRAGPGGCTPGKHYGATTAKRTLREQGALRSECRVWDSNPHVLSDNGF